MMAISDEGFFYVKNQDDGRKGIRIHFIAMGRPG
jgi:hypothetical protein